MKVCDSPSDITVSINLFKGGKTEFKDLSIDIDLPSICILLFLSVSQSLFSGLCLNPIMSPLVHLSLMSVTLLFTLPLFHECDELLGPDLPEVPVLLDLLGVVDHLPVRHSVVRRVQIGVIAKL